MTAFRNPLRIDKESAPEGRRARLVAQTVVYAASALAALSVLAAAGLLVIASVAQQDLRLDRPHAAALRRVLDKRAPLSPFNVLVLGLDKEKKGGTRRADTIMLVRVDPLGRRIALLSVPRDCRISLPALRNGNAVSRPSPACAAALAQATRRWPKRDRRKDGHLASAAHNRKNPLSDHRFGLAFDLTHDPPHGVDCNILAEAMRRSRDPRIAYVIFDGWTFSPKTGWRWVRYGGDDPHANHMHVSIASDRWNDVRPWPGLAGHAPSDPGMFNPPIPPLLRLDVPAVRDTSSASKPLLEPAKINRAYMLGGPALMTAKTKEFLDMPIHHYVEVDFQGLADAVDALGGVWVDVPVAIDDWKAASASPNHRARRIPKGLQRLDGEHALTYARSRTYADADISRTRAQQTLVRAIVSRAKSPAGSLRTPLAIGALAEHSRTDLSVREMGWLAELAAPALGSKIDAMTVKGYWRSPFLVVDETQKRKVVRDWSRQRRRGIDPTEITVSVANGSEIPRAAKAAGYTLYQEGYVIAGVGNLPTKNHKETLVVAREGDLAAAKQVAKELPLAKAVESHGDYQFMTRVLVIVGADWRQ